MVSPPLTPRLQNVPALPPFDLSCPTPNPTTTQFHWSCIQAVGPPGPDGEPVPDHAAGPGGSGGDPQQQQQEQLHEVGETREAQETRLVDLYTEAMQAQLDGRHELAKHTYRQILDGPLLQDVAPADELLLRMRYLSTKNTAELLQAEGRASEALQAYVQATEVDGGDVVVWLHLGRLSEARGFFRAARYAYERGLGCQAEATWECLEGLARALEALGDWVACLDVLQRGLRLDPTHPGFLERRARVRKAYKQAAAPAAPQQPPPHGQATTAQVVVLDGDVDDGWPSMQPPQPESPVFLKTTPATVISLTLDPQSKTHAWTELGRTLLAATGSGLSRPVILEAKTATRPASSDSSSSAVGPGRGPPGRRTVRVTEAERLRQVQEATAAAAAAAAAALGGDGDDQSQVSSANGMGTEEENARRASNRQQLRKRAKEVGERIEASKDKKQGAAAVRGWLDAHLLATGEEGAGPADVLPQAANGGNNGGGDDDDDLGWWATDYSGQPQEQQSAQELALSAARRGMFHAAASDEGAGLVMKRFRPFKGTHNSLCDVCGDGGELICCETCSTVYHMGCLLAPPGLSEAFYCDRCREEAYRLANRQPPRVSDEALFSSQIEEISNEFLPSVLMNLGALDLMHRLVLRLTRVREARIWEDGSLRGVTLALEAAARPFARDVERHTCRQPAQLELDFGPEGELFLAELHLDELLLGASADATTASMSRSNHGVGPKSKTTTAAAPGAAAAGAGAGAAPSSDSSSRPTSSSSAASNASTAAGALAASAGGHDAVCDILVAKLLEAMALEKRQRQEKATDVEDGMATEAFSPEYLCRFAWLRALLATWRGDTQEAEAFLKQCWAHLEQAGLGARIEQPHCQRHPCISLDAIATKRKELTERSECFATRRLVTAFRKGTLQAGGGGSAEAARGFLGMIRRRFLDLPEGGRESMHQVAELLTDFLEHEAGKLLDALKHGGGRTANAVKIFCRGLDRLDVALQRHSSILVVTLVTCAKVGDLKTTIRLLHLGLHHLVQADPWGDKLIATHLRSLPPALAARARPDLNRLNVLLLETLCELLGMALREGWPTGIRVPPELQAHLPSTLASLLRFSSLPYSRVMLDAVLAVYKVLGTNASSSAGAGEELAEQLERAVFRSLAGVLCDPQLEPDFLQHYTNTAAARDYCRGVLQHMCNLLDDDSAWAVAPARGVLALSARQLRALVAAMRNLAQLPVQNAALYGTTLFTCYLSLTFLVLQHPSMDATQRVAWLRVTHEALAEMGSQCGQENGRFLKAALKVMTGVAGSATEWKEEDSACEGAVQCIRCLYNVDLTPGSTAADHQAGGRAPKGLSETLGLATFVLRSLEEAQDTALPKKQLFTALQLAYEEEPIFQEPLVWCAQFPPIESFLLRGVVARARMPMSPRASTGDDAALNGAARGQGPDGLVAMLQEAEKRAEASAAAGAEGEEAARRSSLAPPDLLHYNSLKRKVKDPALLVYAYQRLYAYLGELSPAPKFLKRKNQSDAEAYKEYEVANVDVLRVHLLDLRFNPHSLATWMNVTERAWHLYLLYLDHCPAFGPGEKGGALPACLEQALRHLQLPTEEKEGAGHLLPPPIPPSLEPFLDIAFFEDLSGDQQGAMVCEALEKMGQGHLLDPLDPKARELEVEVGWASIVVAVYRVFVERCLQVLDGLLKHRLEENPRDRELAAKRIEARFRQAVMLYMRRYEATAETQATLLAEALAHAQAAQEMEETYAVRSPRWDICLLVGKLLEKGGRARHGGGGGGGGQQSYAEIEAAEPGWLDSFLTMYRRALELAEGHKMARKDALYRLHSSRLRALLSDRRSPDGPVAAPSPALLKVLCRFNLDPTDHHDADACAEGLVCFRWRLLMDAMGALAECRRLDNFDHRSVYQRARAYEHLVAFLPPGGGGLALEEEKGLTSAAVAALASASTGVAGEAAALSLEAARDLMHVLFEKKRSQIVAVWLAEECTNALELMNQRNLKYESIRRRYITYYLDLLRRTRDCERLLELHRNVRTLKESTNQLLHWTQGYALEYLTEVLGHLVATQRADHSETCLEAAYETYLDMAEAANAGCGRRRKGHSVAEAHGQRQQRHELMTKLGTVVVQAYQARGGSEEGAATTTTTLEAALEYGHEKWPEKQGRAKLGAVKPSMKRALTAATAESPSQNGSNSPRPPPQQGQEQQQEQGQDPKRRRVQEELEEEEGMEEEGKQEVLEQVPPPPPPAAQPARRVTEIVESLDDDDDDDEVEEILV